MDSAEQPAHEGLLQMKAPVYDVDIMDGTGSADVGNASSGAGRLPPAATAGVQDEVGDVEADVAGDAGSAGLLPPPPPTSPAGVVEDGHVLAAADGVIGGGVETNDDDLQAAADGGLGVENDHHHADYSDGSADLSSDGDTEAEAVSSDAENDDLVAADGGLGVQNDHHHADYSDGSADLSSEGDTEAGVVSSDAENDDKAAAEDCDVTGLGCGGDANDEVGNLRAAARLVLVLGLGVGAAAAAALAFFATEPRYVYDLGEQQGGSTKDAFAEPDHEPVLQCGAGDMDLAVQRFCYPPGATATATATPHAPHPLIMETGESEPSALASAMYYPRVSSGPVDWVNHHRGGTSTAAPPLTTTTTPTPARLQSVRVSAPADQRSRFLAYLFAFGIAMALVAVIQHGMLLR